MNFLRQQNKLILQENQTEIGSATFVPDTNNTKRLVHVFVDPAHRGAGIASQLVAECVAWAKQEGFLIAPICPYAVTWFSRHPEHVSVLAK